MRLTIWPAYICKQHGILIVIKDIIKHHEGMDLNFAIPYEGTLYAPKDDDYIRDLARDDRVPYKVVDFDVFLNEPRAKLIIVCAPDYMDKVIEKSKSFSFLCMKGKKV